MIDKDVSDRDLRTIPELHVVPTNSWALSSYMGGGGSSRMMSLKINPLAVW